MNKEQVAIALVTFVVSSCTNDKGGDEASTGTTTLGEESAGTSIGTDGGGGGTTTVGSAGGTSSGGSSAGPGSATDTAAGSETAGTTGDGDTESTGTGGTPANPQEGEPCDPILAMTGEAPCEGPGDPSRFSYTCTTVPYTRLNETHWEFECVQVRDTAGDGFGTGDNCTDDSGRWYTYGTHAGCLNGYCLGNGLGNNPDVDEHRNWPDGQCPFGSLDTYLSKACCTPYCDDDNPCDPGWTCKPVTDYQAVEPDTDIGFCIWNG